MSNTAENFRAEAAAHRAEAAASFERCDTDGFVSQWASGVNAAEASAKAELAENDGKITVDALFNLDGTIASTHEGNGQYGTYWVLNDMSTEKFGKRFYSPSKADKSKTRRKNNAAKGFTVGTISVNGYVTLAGSGTGLSGALSVRPVIRPVIDDLKSGNFDIIATDDDTIDY